MRKTNTRCQNFVRFVRERLLRRLQKYTITASRLVLFCLFRFHIQILPMILHLQMIVPSQTLIVGKVDNAGTA